MIFADRYFPLISRERQQAFARRCPAHGLRLLYAIFLYSSSLVGRHRALQLFVCFSSATTPPRRCDTPSFGAAACSRQHYRTLFRCRLRRHMLPDFRAGFSLSDAIFAFLHAPCRYRVSRQVHARKISAARRCFRCCPIDDIRRSRRVEPGLGA